PWLMPDFWQFPTGSMGIGPLNAIYQARFMRYLQHRGVLETESRHVWGVFGDGEMDEPESTAGLTLAAREGLDNLTFIVNCNLQRLDGPVRGNGQIIQELEALFSG
ncbi:pyruvate dehydrogenase (acetyl-transferring), homodimeric type, partial [Pseudomonas otitidis]